MRFTADEVTAMLVDYVERRLMPSEFARKNKMGLAAAKCLLKGLSYPEVPRPEGFAYPWPRNPNRHQQIGTERWRAEVEAALRAYVEQRMDTKQFAAYVGLSITRARDILAGRSWIIAERPEGFQWPFPEHMRVTRHRMLDSAVVEEGLKLFWRGKWTVMRLARYWGVRRHLASEIVNGKTYKEIPRPWRTKRPRREEMMRRREYAMSQPRKRRHELHAP